MDIRIRWTKRRAIPICFLVVLIALLTCWHRPVMEVLYSAWRRGEVRAAMNNAGGRKSRCRYRIRGPLSIAQVELELFRRTLGPSDLGGASESTDPGRVAWEKMKAKYRDGDELYFVSSDERSWARLEGWRGYVLIRGNTYVDVLTTLLN